MDRTAPSKSFMRDRNSQILSRYTANTCVLRIWVVSSPIACVWHDQSQNPLYWILTTEIDTSLSSVVACNKNQMMNGSRRRVLWVTNAWHIRADRSFLRSDVVRSSALKWKSWMKIRKIPTNRWRLYVCRSVRSSSSNLESFCSFPFCKDTWRVDGSDMSYVPRVCHSVTWLIPCLFQKHFVEVNPKTL